MPDIKETDLVKLYAKWNVARRVITLALLCVALLVSTNSLAGKIEKPPKKHKKQFVKPFIKNQLSFGFYAKDFINIHIPEPPSPLFWKASLKVDHGVMLIYRHMLYHRGFLSISVGSSISRWVKSNEHVYAFSAFFQLRLWLFLRRHVSFYLLYSAAGPTMITDRTFATSNFSENFLFQDILGFGMQIGQSRAFTLEAYTVHYSNGDIFPKNSGIQVPFVIALGYAFP